MDGEGKGFIARKILSNTSMILELNFLAGLVFASTYKFPGFIFHMSAFGFLLVVAIKTLRTDGIKFKATLSLLLGIGAGSVVFLW